MLFPPSASHPSSSSPIRFLHATHWRLCKMWAIIHRSFIPCPSFPTAKSLIGGGGGGGDSSAAGDGQLGQLKWTTSSADHPLCSVMLRSLRVHLTFLLLLTLPLPAAMNSCGLDYKWSCGASPSPYQLSLSEQMSCSVAVPACPRTINAINNCCVRHDACYSLKMGQQYCDEVFCRCLCISQWDGPICALQVGNGFCLMVRVFGALIYNSK